MSRDILARYPQVTDQPRDMALFCTALRKRGLSADALAMGMAAVAAAPDDMEIRDMVRAALSQGVPNWHVPMLHDRPRNRCYVEAIARDVKPGMLVLEIGSGAGLLALLAARAGAQVVTCEANPIVAAAAAENARRNGLADRITVITKLSTDLEMGIDLPHRADLLMSELFDDTLFGDNILSYLDDARERLMKPDAILLPARSSLRCALVETPQSGALESLSDVEGFDLSPMNLLAPPPSDSARVGDQRVRRHSAPIFAMPMNYNAAGSFGETGQRVSFTSTGGRVTGVAQWLHIDFGDGIIFENDPFAEEPSHWGSPIFFFTEPRETVAGEIVEVDIRVEQQQLLMRLAHDPA